MKTASIKLKAAINESIEEAKILLAIEDFETGWLTLATAHIISQPYPILHFRVHLQMLKLAIKQSNKPEILGQLLRLFAAIPGSIIGLYPHGNTGRSNVSIFLPMSVSEVIKKKLKTLEQVLFQASKE